jgi:hypothetical protein
MSEALISTSQECYLPVINIPSIAEAMEEMKTSMELASMHFQEAALSIERRVLDSNFLEESAYDEATAHVALLLQSTFNLEIARNEIVERMASLEELLSRKAVIPDILSTSDDISVAFHIAVNGPEIDWPFAEMVLERFSILWIEELRTVDNDEDSVFRQNVWCDNNFDSNMVRLLQGGNCWRVSKSLELILKIVDDEMGSDILISAELFDALASIILIPVRADLLNEELQWAYLIAKNQKTAVDHGVSRLINSYLHSWKGKSRIDSNVMNILSALVSGENSPEMNCIHFSSAPNIPKALVLMLSEEKGNTDIIEICLQLGYRLVTVEPLGVNESLSDYGLDVRVVRSNFIKCGICEVIFPVMQHYITEQWKIENALYIIHSIINRKSFISRFVSAGLLHTLVPVFYAGHTTGGFPGLVRTICEYEPGFIRRFHDLGIPEGSSFFGV